MKRIADEPAFVIHHYDWSESSLILEVFTLMWSAAKEATVPSVVPEEKLTTANSLSLVAAYATSGDAEIRTLKSAEWAGSHVMPAGEALLSGYYLNELLMRLLARDDPHAALFDIYAALVRVLAAGSDAVIEPALRALELLLLRETGLLPALALQTLTLLPLLPHEPYCLVPPAGLRAAGDADRHVLTGRQWAALQQALQSAAPLGPTAAVCGDMPPALKPQLRAWLHYHCGVTAFRTRQILLDIQSL